LPASKATVINEKDEAVPATILLTDQRGVSISVDAKDGSAAADVPPGRYSAVAKAEATC